MGVGVGLLSFSLSLSSFQYLFIFINLGIEEKINKVIKNNQVYTFCCIHFYYIKINYNNEILLFLVSSELSQFEKLNSPKNQSRENDYDIVDDNNNETNEPFLPSKESSGAARCRFYFGS